MNKKAVKIGMGFFIGIVLAVATDSYAAPNMIYDSFTWQQYTGNGDSYINPGDSVFLRPVIYNTGTGDAYDTYAWLTTSNPYATINGIPYVCENYYGTMSYWHEASWDNIIAPGEKGTTSSQCGLVSFAANTPPGTSITFTLNIQEAFGWTGSMNFSTIIWAADATPPTGLPGIPYSATPYTNNLVFLWSSATDPETGIIGYYLQVGLNPATNDASIFNAELSAVTQKQITPITDGQVYYARVRARNGANQYGSWTNWSQGVTAKLTLPGAPSNITSYTHPDTRQLALPFAAIISGPADVSGISGYYWKVDQNPATVPTNADSFSAAVVEVQTPLADGNWVFHAVAKDGAGNTGTAAKHYNFSVKSTVQSNASTTIETADGTKLIVPAGTIPLSAQVFISSRVVVPNVPANSGMLPAGINRDFSFSSGIEQFQNSLTIQIPYTLPLPPGVVESNLKSFRYNESGNTWQLVPGSTVDTVNKLVSAQTNHFSLFSVMSFVPSGTALADLSNYPNPFSPLRGQTTKIRYNLDAAGEVKIIVYDAYGFVVWGKTLPSGAIGAVAGPNEVAWDGKNGNGVVVGSGGYICIVKSAGQKKITKIAIK